MSTETITRQYREPFVETAGIGLTNEALKYLKQAIPTTSYTGQQFVAGLAPVEQEAISARGGLGAYQPYLSQAGQLGTAAQQALGGAASYIAPDAYKQFMSPYQKEVIDTSLAALNREQAKGLNELRQRAIQSGAFGGGREGTAMGEYQATSDIQRALAEAQIRQQGFQQAQAAAQQAAAQQLGLGQAYQGLGQFQSQLGQTGQQLAQQQITGLGQLGNLQRQLSQAQLSAKQEAAREAAFEPYTRLGLIGPQLASVIGGFPAATQVQTAPPPSLAQQLLGIGIGGAGLMGAAKQFGMFG